MRDLFFFFCRFGSMAFALIFIQVGEVGGQEVEAVSSFGSWSVFNDEVACWVATTGVTRPDEDVSSKEDLMFVSFFFGSQSPEISFSLTECCGTSAFARSGENTLMLFFADGIYFHSQDPLDFLLGMLNGSSVDIVYTQEVSRDIFFSLEGFKAAYNEVSRICDFRPIQLDEDVRSTSRS